MIEWTKSRRVIGTCVFVGLALFLATALFAREASDMKKIKKSDNEWKEILTPEQYCIVREKGTERAFTGAYWDHKEDGQYVCVACGLPLFSSENKFDSKTGWPSFWKPAKDESVGEKKDFSWGMNRTEIHCARCEAHLGHVFDDGPTPTGQRYCINSGALKFEPKNKPQQEA